MPDVQPIPLLADENIAIARITFDPAELPVLVRYIRLIDPKRDLQLRRQ